MEFTDSYWRDLAPKLDVSDETKHAYFAEFVSDHFRDKIRYIPGQAWYRWTGTHWKAAADSAPAFQAVTDAAGVLYRRAGANPADGRWVADAAAKMYVEHIRAGIVREMERLIPFRIEVTDLNRDENLLNFTNGTIDLRTGELRAHDPEDAITYVVEYDYKPEAASDRWLGFLESSQPNDPEMHTFLQRLAGYGLTGSTTEEILAFHYGSGANGKSVFMETLRTIFAPIVTTQNNDFWEKGKHERSGALIAKLHGARMVFSSEMSAARLDEIFLKAFVTGDAMTANPKHKRPFDFTPTSLLIMCGNDKPTINGTDDGIWRRFRCVPWDESFLGREDRALKPDLLKPEHAEGIISWAVAGAVEWYREGLNSPARIEQATAEYREESNPFTDWLVENFEADPEGFVTTAEIKQTTANLRLPGTDRKHKQELVRYFNVGKDAANAVKKINGKTVRGVRGVRRIDSSAEAGAPGAPLRVIPSVRPA